MGNGQTLMRGVTSTVFLREPEENHHQDLLWLHFHHVLLCGFVCFASFMNQPALCLLVTFFQFPFSFPLISGLFQEMEMKEEISFFLSFVSSFAVLHVDPDQHE